MAPLTAQTAGTMINNHLPSPAVVSSWLHELQFYIMFIVVCVVGMTLVFWGVQRVVMRIRGRRWRYRKRMWRVERTMAERLQDEDEVQDGNGGLEDEGKQIQLECR